MMATARRCDVVGDPTLPQLLIQITFQRCVDELCAETPRCAYWDIDQQSSHLVTRDIMIRAAVSLIALLLTAPVGSETVDVRDRGAVDLATFDCRDINRSTLIQRVCYDQAHRMLIVGIRGSYADYCELPQQTFERFMTAPSMGQFFNQNIGKSGPDARYDCQTDRRAEHWPAADAVGTQSVSIAPTSASATVAPLTLASP
jgi:hypothetical protein